MPQILPTTNWGSNNAVCWRPVFKTFPVCVFVLLRGVCLLFNRIQEGTYHMNRHARYNVRSSSIKRTSPQQQLNTSSSKETRRSERAASTQKALVNSNPEASTFMTTTLRIPHVPEQDEAGAVRHRCQQGSQSTWYTMTLKVEMEFIHTDFSLSREPLASAV